MRSNDSFNFPLGLIKYIVIVVMVSVDVKHHVYFAENSDRIAVQDLVLAEILQQCSVV